MCYSIINPCRFWTWGTLSALASNGNTLYNVMGVKRQIMPVDLAESESISGTEINLTVCALGNGVLCCNLAESKSLLSHFALESGMLFEGTTGVYERIYGFNSKWVRLILMAFSLDYVLISLGENWCSSLMGLIGTRRYLNTTKLYLKQPLWQAPFETRNLPCSKRRGMSGTHPGGDL